MDEKSRQPLYQKVRDTILEQITSGKYAPHCRIPSENELSEMYSVSRVTVRKALEALEKDGFLERVQGSGTFVSVPRIAKNLANITSFHQTCLMMGLEPSIRVIRTDVAGIAKDEEGLFSHHRGDRILEVTRLCLADNEPVMLEKNRYAPELIWLRNENLSGSIYEHLKAHGIAPDHGSHEISLCYASEEEAHLLQTSVGEALLFVSEVIRDAKGRVLQISRQYVRGDRFTFRI